MSSLAGSALSLSASTSDYAGDVVPRAAAKRAITTGAVRRLRGHAAASAATRDAIVEAAHTVLMRDGYPKLSVRRVASELGMSSGNMMYHFPTKQRLMRVVIAKLLADYRAHIEAVLGGPSTPPEERLTALFHWMMLDALNPATQRLFLELFAIATRDADVAKMLTNFYEELFDLQTRAFPHVLSARNNRLSMLKCLMTVLIDGTGTLYSHGLKRLPDPKEFVSFVTAVFTWAREAQEREVGGTNRIGVGEVGPRQP